MKIPPALPEAYAAAGRHLLRNTTLHHYTWRHHGLGMLQAELDDTLRIHIFHPELVRLPEGMRRVHDHRFDLTSMVLHGTVVDVPYIVTPESPPKVLEQLFTRATCWEIVHAKQQGEAAVVSKEVGSVYVRRDGEERRWPVQSLYTIPRRSFHTSRVEGLAVTLVHRSFFDDGPAHVLSEAGVTSVPSAIVKSEWSEKARYVEMATRALASA